MEQPQHSFNEEVPPVRTSQSFPVKSGSTIEIHLVLNASDKVHGSFKILRAYRYGDKELQFKVLDTTETARSSKPVLLDLGKVENDVSFDFIAGSSGDYLLVFDNKPSSSESNSQKEIQLKYEISNLPIKSKQDVALSARE